MRIAKDGGPYRHLPFRLADSWREPLSQLRIVVLGLVSAFVLMAQGAVINRPITSAYVDKAGHVHVVYGEGQDVEIQGEKDQVSAHPPVVAPDRRTAGWLVLMPNCCTSYPIPTTLVIYAAGRVVQRINDGMMIYKWVFLDNGRRVAISSGTVHGMYGIHLTLYDTQTGKLLSTWDGEEGKVPPKWGGGIAH